MTRFERVERLVKLGHRINPYPYVAYQAKIEGRPSYPKLKTVIIFVINDEFNAETLVQWPDGSVHWRKLHPKLVRLLELIFWGHI